MKLELCSLTPAELTKYKKRAEDAIEKLLSRNGAGSEYLGWINQPKSITNDELSTIEDLASKVRVNSDILVVVGIGGSYLGSRAVIEALTSKYFNNGVEILFAGNHLSSTELAHMLEYLSDKNFTVNVISKSGTTIEPSIAFRLLRDLMSQKYTQSEIRDRIIVTTDESKGALRELVNKEGYESFAIPDNIGGRYSVFTPVGLFPIAVAGLDIRELVGGASAAVVEFSNNRFEENDAMKYAAIRNILYNRGKVLEIKATYEPSLNSISEWWKQLFGESEGKDGVGIFPTSATFTTDLHSLGQIIQDGKRNIFETVLSISKPIIDIKIPKETTDFDNLNRLSTKTVDFVNKQASNGAIKAHRDGGVPVIVIELEELTENTLGHLLYFYMISCGISAYILGVNPFNQPGVEEYKKNMFNLIDSQ